MKRDKTILAAYRRQITLNTKVVKSKKRFDRNKFKKELKNLSYL
ncbi:hypothetical protein HMPREF1139_0791 [Campylobacter sp. FOBRC14]|nr:hypothetical protein HMPREF1139_0791 [Campylobacter sp. FOBRC14]